MVIAARRKNSEIQKNYVVDWPHIHTKATWQTCCHCALLAMTVTAAPYVTYAQVAPAVLSLVSPRFWLKVMVFVVYYCRRSWKWWGISLGSGNGENRKLYTSILAVSSEHHGITNAAIRSLEFPESNSDRVQSPSTLPAIIQTSESLISDLWLFQSQLHRSIWPLKSRVKKGGNKGTPLPHIP